MRKTLIAAATGAAVLGFAGTALAVTGGSPANTVSGCLTPARTVVDVHNHTSQLTCPRGDRLIQWNITGPVGAPGKTGPKGATGAAGPPGPSGVVSTSTTDLGGVSSVPTGGHFVSSATLVKTVALKAGTYVVSLNAKATPNVSNSVEVFPQFFVYNQVANANFNGDLFNVGSGSLALNNTNIDSYFSGSTVITLSADTTLYVYAFGYDSDRGSSTYTLDDVTLTATQINTGS